MAQLSLSSDLSILDREGLSLRKGLGFPVNSLVLLRLITCKADMESVERSIASISDGKNGLTESML